VFGDGEDISGEYGGGGEVCSRWWAGRALQSSTGQVKNERDVKHGMQVKYQIHCKIFSSTKREDSTSSF
jgi:hypothetical protein